MRDLREKSDLYETILKPIGGGGRPHRSPFEPTTDWVSLANFEKYVVCYSDLPCEFMSVLYDDDVSAMSSHTIFSCVVTPVRDVSSTVKYRSFVYILIAQVRVPLVVCCCTCRVRISSRAKWTPVCVSCASIGDMSVLIISWSKVSDEFHSNCD